MKNIFHDFFPSSLKLFNDENAWFLSEAIVRVGVTPGAKLTSKVGAKQINGLVPAMVSQICLHGGNGKTERYMGANIPCPIGTFEWRELNSTPIRIPDDVIVLVIRPLIGAAPDPSLPTTTWFADLKIYMDDKLIYENDFANWNPYIGAGIGTPIGGAAAYLLKEPLGPIVSEVVGAGLGALGGGVIGLLTAIGVIPIPTIPTFEAPPEMPVGRYQVVG